MRRTILFLGLLALLTGPTFREPVRASTEDNSCIEEFELENVQTLSPTYAQRVSSHAYLDRTTVVMLLSSG